MRKAGERAGTPDTPDNRQWAGTMGRGVLGGGLDSLDLPLLSLECHLGTQMETPRKCQPETGG